MKLIGSRDNPLFKSLYRLSHDPREIRKQRRTLIDGPHLVRAYFDSGAVPRMLLVSESGQRHIEVSALIEALKESDFVLLKDALFKALSGVESPVGVAALIDVPSEPELLGGEDCVLLDDIQDAGNVGSIMRTSAALGVRDILLGPGCAGAWTPRVLRAAQGAHFRLRIREAAELAAVIRDYHGNVLTTSVSGGVPLSELALSGNIAWIFGNEGRGVSPHLAALSSMRVTIPMVNAIESLNVAAAAAICLFATARIG